MKVSTAIFLSIIVAVLFFVILLCCGLGPLSLIDILYGGNITIGACIIHTINTHAKKSAPANNNSSTT